MPFVPLADFIRGKCPATRDGNVPMSRRTRSGKGRGVKTSGTRSCYQHNNLGGQYREECMRARSRKGRGGKTSDAWPCYRHSDLGGQYYEECMRARDVKRPPVLHIRGDYELTLYKVDMDNTLLLNDPVKVRYSDIAQSKPMTGIETQEQSGDSDDQGFDGRQTPDFALQEKRAWNVPYYIGSDGLFVPLYANAYVQSPPQAEGAVETSGMERELVPVPQEWLDSECSIDQALDGNSGVGVENERTSPQSSNTSSDSAVRPRIQCFRYVVMIDDIVTMANNMQAYTAAMMQQAAPVVAGHVAEVEKKEPPSPWHHGHETSESERGRRHNRRSNTRPSSTNSHKTLCANTGHVDERQKNSMRDGTPCQIDASRYVFTRNGEGFCERYTSNKSAKGESSGYKLETAFEHYAHQVKATEKRWRDALASWQIYEEEIMKMCTPCGACGVTPYEREQLRIKYKSRFNPCRVCSEESSQLHNLSTASSGNRSGTINHFPLETSDTSANGAQQEEETQHP